MAISLGMVKTLCFRPLICSELRANYAMLLLSFKGLSARWIVTLAARLRSALTQGRVLK